MRKTKILMASCLMAMISCENQNLDQKLETWCTCERKAAQNPELKDSCSQIMFEISDEYAFDPESLPKIERAVNNCE